MPTQTGSIDLASQKAAYDAAAQVATNYISVDSTGMMVADGDGTETPSTATTRNVFIDSDSVEIRDGQDSIASFGGSVRVGRESEPHIEITGSAVELIGDSKQPVAYIAADENGLTTLFTARIVATDGIRFGNWRFYEDKNGNMVLKWVGDTIA